jgi:hypothetical protein
MDSQDKLTILVEEITAGHTLAQAGLAVGLSASSVHRRIKDLPLKRVRKPRLSRQERRAIISALRQMPTRQRPRLMSRREAFVRLQSRSELMRLPESLVPEILGPNLGDVLPLDMDATLQVKDKYIPNKYHSVAGMCVLPSGCHTALNRGSKYLVHLNPLSAGEAFISTPDGVYIGKAPVLIAGTKFDFNHRNLAILNEMERGVLKKLAPVAEKRMRERAEQAETNIALFTADEDAVNDMREQAEAVVRRRNFKPAALLDDEVAERADDDFEDAVAVASPRFNPAALL